MLRCGPRSGIARSPEESAAAALASVPTPDTQESRAPRAASSPSMRASAPPCATPRRSALGPTTARTTSGVSVANARAPELRSGASAESAEYKGSVSRRAELAPELEQAVVGFAKRAFRATGLRGYGRVDFRLDSGGAPYALDVNPNPDLSRGAGLCLAAERAGMMYEDLVEGIVREAIERKR